MTSITDNFPDKNFLYQNSMLHKADVLIVTATEVESRAVMQVFEQAVKHKPIPQSIDGRVYFNLGKVNDAHVSLTQSEMGSGGLGASQLTVGKGIEALSPTAVIMVGIAFGINEEKQDIGDILVAGQLRPYDLQRIGTQNDRPKIILRGDKPHASSWLINHFRSAQLIWEGAKVRFGVVLTGESLVDNVDFRDQLLEFEPEAIGGEMEGAGLYVACQDKKVDWILVKGICDWADGNKAQEKDIRQQNAAQNAAKFVLESLQFVQIDWERQQERLPILDNGYILPDGIINVIDVDIRHHIPITLKQLKRDGQIQLIEFPSRPNKECNYNFSYSIILENIGKVNIDEFKIEISYEFKNLNNIYFFSSPTTFPRWNESYRDGFTNQHILSQIKPVVHGGSISKRNSEPLINIYPSDKYILNMESFFYLYENFPEDDYLFLNWALYLKNSPPKTGKIDISEIFRKLDND